MLACRPMLCLAIAVMAGILLARTFPGHYAFIAAGWAAFGGGALWFVLSPGKPFEPPADILPEGYGEHIYPYPGPIARRGLNRFLFLLCLGFLLIGMMRQELWRHRLDPARLPDRQWFDAACIALAPNREYDAESGRWHIPARLLGIDGNRSGGILVRLGGPEGPAIRRGDIVQARVRRGSVSPRAYPGAFDFNFWLERDGMLGTLEATGGGRAAKNNAPYRVVAIDSPGAITTALRMIDSIRGRAIAATLKHGGPEGPMLATMLYGYRKDMAADTRDAFRRAGIGHVLAISGLHVGLIVGLLWWLGGLTGWSLRTRALACLALSILYLGLSGGQVAATRATMMAAIHLGGIAWGRKSDMLNSLGAAAFLLALHNPTAPLDVGFQLSFTAVVFIYMAMRRRAGTESLARPLPGGHAHPAWRRRVVRGLSSLTNLSVATWIGLYPIIAVVFNQVNPVGLPINIVVIPLMSLVLAGGLLLPWLGWIPGMAWLLTLPGRMLTWLAVRADNLPYSSFSVHAPRLTWVCMFYLFVFLFLLRGVFRPGVFRKWWERGAALGFLACLIGLSISMRSAPPPAGGRLAVLPGRGIGMIAAEAENGSIALLGSLRRGGLAETGWLHFLRRSGGVAVVTTEKPSPGQFSTLKYHYPLEKTTYLPTIDKRSPNMASTWRMVPGAPGVEYAVVRDGEGRLLWLAVRTGGQSLCISSPMSVRQFTGLLERKIPGSDADMLCITLSGKPADLPPTVIPHGRVALRGVWRGSLPAGWFERSGLGVLEIEGGSVRAFNGRQWIEPRDHPYR